MLGAEVRVIAKRHFQFVQRFASDTRGKNLVQTLEGVMVTLLSANAFFDRETRFHGVLQGAEASERGD
jgi:hypothetical protein